MSNALMTAQRAASTSTCVEVREIPPQDVDWNHQPRSRIQVDLWAERRGMIEWAAKRR